MRTRAAAAEATRCRILDTAVTLLRTAFRSDIRLEDVAQGARVTVQTVLRVFGSRSRLLELATQQLLREVEIQRQSAQPGDIEGSIAALVEHYEQVGDIAITNLAQEADPAAQPLLRIGRIKHREWVERQFGPQLDLFDARHRPLLVDALVCACDVYTWKLLRRDMARSRAQTQATIAHAIKALLRS